MKTILLIGSSIFEAWASAPDLFPHWHTVNRAVGGTVTSDWTSSVAGTLDAESPDVVWYYCGSNDLNRDIPQDEIIANVMHCRGEIYRKSTSITFVYFGIIKAPQKEGKWEIIEALNVKIQAELKPGDLYIDTNSIFFPGTEPDTELFIEDGLHLTAKGYTRLSNYAKPVIGMCLNNGTLTNRSDARDGN